MFVVPCDSTTEKGKSHLLKLADFGLCCLLVKDNSAYESSSVGMLNVFSHADQGFFFFRTMTEILVNKLSNYKILTAHMITALFNLSSCLVVYGESVRMFC